MKYLTQILLLIVISAPSALMAQSSVTAETEGAGKKWRVILDAQHVPVLRNDQFNYTDLTAIGEYFLSPKHRIRVAQFGTKLYSKYESEYEIQPSDTRLYHYYNMDAKPMGASLLLRNDIALPISDASVRDDLVTNFTSTLFISKTFLQNRLFVSLRPMARYHWYKYRTSPGGRRLPLYTFGSSLILSMSLTDKISFLTTGYYSIFGTNSSQYDPAFVQKEEGIYSFSTSLNYQVLPELGIYGSYSSGPANYIYEGRYEVYLYDQNTSRLGFGMTAIF